MYIYKDIKEAIQIYKYMYTCKHHHILSLISVMSKLLWTIPLAT